MDTPPDTKPYHLFVVEDDLAMRDMLAAYLEEQGMAVTAMAMAEDMLRGIRVAAHPPARRAAVLTPAARCGFRGGGESPRGQG